MRKQILLCIDLIARLQGGTLKVGENRYGSLVMTEDQERLEFDEEMPQRYKRNPKVWRGKMLNVHRDKYGLYQVHFNRLLLRKQMSPERIGKAICRELTTAIKVLGL